MTDRVPRKALNPNFKRQIEEEVGKGNYYTDFYPQNCFIRYVHWRNEYNSSLEIHFILGKINWQEIANQMPTMKNLCDSIRESKTTPGTCI